MSASTVGRIGWSMKRDRDGHRDYSLTMLVETTDPADGPAVVYFASGLPAIGSTWNYGNDSDPWAFCSPESTVTPIVTPERNRLWKVEIPFTTKPFKRCQDTSVENPLNEPQQVSGSFVKYQRELRYRADNGQPIISSSFEWITGIEVDASRPTVSIEQNVPSLGLNVFSQMIDKVNDKPLWGLAAGRIKLDNIAWSRKVYGSCYFYYTRKMDFSIRYEGYTMTDIPDVGYKTFDTNLEDNATNRAKPSSYVIHRDRRGDSAPQRIALDGEGNQNDDPIGNPVDIDPVTPYASTNFLLLGIPLSF